MKTSKSDNHIIQKKVSFLYTSGQSIQDLATEFNVCKSTIRNWLHNQNITLRTRNFAIPEYKTCHRCMKYLYKDKFSRRKFHAKDGRQYIKLRSECISCHKIRMKKHFSLEENRLRKNQQRNLALTQSFYNRLKVAISRYKRHTPSSDVTIEYLFDLWQKQDGKCYYSNINMVWSISGLQWDRWSLDRLIPENGYMQNNVVFCTYLVNTMKQKMTENDFYVFMKQILLNRQQI